MKMIKVLPLALATVLGVSVNVRAQAPSIETMAPVVVKTVPLAGSDDVAPGVVEIKVTFSKAMSDNSWSWSSAWDDSTPEPIGKPRYEADHKTCVIKVKLEPNRNYAYWLNSQKFTGFRDADGRVAVPYLLAFKTKAK
jgi:RNA polymerase sigma-70 factor (ECF subfamily)